MEGFVSPKGSMSIIKCECGAEILLVPQVELMGSAIEAHAAEHEGKELNPARAKAAAKRIRELLIKQVLSKAIDR